MTWLDPVLTVLWLAGTLWVLYRWPWTSLGTAAGLYLWTVDPAACWAVLILTAIYAGTMRAANRPQPTAQRPLHWFARRPALAVVVVSAAVSGLAEPPIAPIAFVVLLVSLGLTAVSWPKTTETTPVPVVVSDTRPVDTIRWGPCPNCDGFLAVSNRDQPRATCSDCGIRFVGVLDALAPDTGLTWLQVPAVS